MKDELPADLATWLDDALADAARRGLPELAPLLRSLARSTAALRAAAWNDSVAERAAIRTTPANGLGRGGERTETGR